jgi:hypothetical protein
VSAGNDYWIWPGDDVVIEVDKADPKITLAWMRRPESGTPSPIGTARRLMVQFQMTIGTTFSAFREAPEGLDGGLLSGTLTVPLGPRFRQSGTVLLFLEQTGGTRNAPVSNLLQLQIQVVERTASSTGTHSG